MTPAAGRSTESTRERNWRTRRSRWDVRRCRNTPRRGRRTHAARTDPAIPPGPAAHQKTDTSVPHSARVWNHWLGGRTTTRRRGSRRRVHRRPPRHHELARSARAFLRRTVTYLVTGAGIRISTPDGRRCVPERLRNCP
ncbi:SAM-dependent methyltransferase [Streptomyces sp. NPDC050287]|uniref:SAM-dependent methyltransferase n=1 Tax=Streptomyces sp. NPDC050287 TaxID=3365608 RepID=UPI00379F6807